MTQTTANRFLSTNRHGPIGAVVTIVLALGLYPAVAEVAGPLRVPAVVLGIEDPSTFVAEGINDFDDGWRKTADGWEHVSAWEHPPLIASATLSKMPVRDFREVTKYDLHPLAWAVLMVFVSLVALMFLPGSSPPENESADKA